MSIEPTAILDGNIALGDNVSVGPYAVLKGDISISDNTEISAHAVIEGDTRIGKNCFVGIGAVIGNPPQDLKYSGEKTRVVIGDNTVIREYATVNRGTADRTETRIGRNVLLMAYVHIAHDCIVGDEVIMSNAATLAGHVTIEEQAIIGGLTPIHQFTRVGRLAIIGGGSRVPQDIPPFSKSAGNPLKVYGINSIGLDRHGFSREEKSELATAYRFLYRSSLNTSQALLRIREEIGMDSPNIRHLVEFIESSKRGICKK
jgi:UDP-N-acetylglucosamine acyltransferase